jgi:hypothetical protein
VTVRRDYTRTVTDLNALIAKEAEGVRKEQLTRNLDLMLSEITRLRDRTETLGGLEQKVEGLTWLVRSVIVVAVFEFIVGVAVAWVMRK